MCGLIKSYNLLDNLEYNPKLKTFYGPISKIDNTWIDAAKPNVIEFMQLSYDDSRSKYYELVTIAEQSKMAFTTNLNSLNADSICEIMLNIGNALTYRMESYTCAPTVIHVVRILQAAKDAKEKYKTVNPKIYCNGEIQHIDPFCTIGNYGYILTLYLGTVNLD